MEPQEQNSDLSSINFVQLVRNYSPSHTHTVTFQNTWIMSKTSVGTSHVALFIMFMLQRFCIWKWNTCKNQSSLS